MLALAPVLAPAAPEVVRYREPWTSPFRVSSERPHQFVNAEGQHLFVLNKTCWAFFAQRDPEGFLQRARAQGINVLRVTLEGRPYFETLGMELWPWAGSRENPDWSGFNEAYWDEVERRVALAGAYGIGLNVVLYFSLKPENADIERHRPYWEQAVRRLGRHANVFLWEVFNESTRSERFQDACGTFFKERDPWRRPVATSDGTTDDAVWPEKPWMDVAVVHTCTSSEPRHDLRDWYQAIARNTRAHGKPAFNNESGREVRHRNDDGVHRRKQGWLWCMEGAFWTYHSREGCEALDDPDYRGPGQEFVAPMGDYFRSLPFWRMQPNFTACVVRDPELVAGSLATPDRAVVTTYVCGRATGSVWSGQSAMLRLPNGRYRVTFIRPADRKVIGTQEHISRGLRDEVPLPLPAFTDDLTLLLERIERHERTIIEGTR